MYGLPIKIYRANGPNLYKEHIPAIRNNNGNSGYSKHILNTGHTYGSAIDTMKVLTQRKREST
jgi:hypothetical protein